MKLAMKNIIRIAFIVAAIFSTVSCVKDIEESNFQSGKEIQLTFTSAKPILTDIETKTVWDQTNETILWSKGDNIRVAYTVNDVWQGSEAAASETVKAKLYASTALNEATEVASFSVAADFKDTQNQGLTDPVYKFYAVYPSGLVSGTDFNNPPYVPFTLSNEQTPAASSFDKSADVMYATSSEYAGIPSDRSVGLTWHRIVAHADISMKNLQVEEGETLESIKVTAQSGADLVGKHTLDITNGDIALQTNATAGNSVTVKADNLTMTNGAVEFWFTTLPFTATELTFTVKTSKYTYVRTFSNISLLFKGNARNTLSVNMKLAQKFQDYTEDFSDGIGNDFTTSGTEGIWKSGSYNNTYYMKGTAYIASQHVVAESWLLSPYLRILSNESTLSFDQSIDSHFGTLNEEATVWIRVKGGDWTQLSGITYPDEPSSGYSDFETTTSALSSYNGQIVQIGFKYIGTNTNSGAWEIADFKVTNAEPVYYPSFEFTSATTKDVSFAASTVEFTYSAKHLTSEPTVAIKAGSDDIIDGTPTINNGVITVNVKANDDTENAKHATIVVTCEGVTGIPELVLNQAKKENLAQKKVTLDFTAQNYSNEYAVTSLVVEPISATLDKGTNSNAPKYYSSGTAVRCYGGNTITLSSEKTLVKVEFTFGSSDGSNAITSNVGSYSSGVWTGSSNSVTFTIGGTTGNRRIQKIAVTYLDLGGEETETITYQHIFTSKPNTGNNVALSGVSWNITATNLGAYNSANYAGVQIGTSSKDGSITLTSSSAWAYQGATKITEVRLWLNRGGTSVTPTVTIGGKSATSDGTVVEKNSSAGSDYTKATMVTFTPASDGDTGVVVINVTTVKAGYICAIEIDAE